MADSQNSDKDAVPGEIEESCVSCHHAVAGVERTLKPLLSTKATDIENKVNFKVFCKMFFRS